MQPRYVGHPQHKLRATRWGSPGRPKDDRTPCPPEVADDVVEHVFLGPAGALARSIRSGWASQERRGGWPAVLWGRDIFSPVGSIVWEARLSNEMTGEYHAYPVSWERHSPAMPSEVEESLWP